MLPAFTRHNQTVYIACFKSKFVRWLSSRYRTHCCFFSVPFEQRVCADWIENHRNQVTYTSCDRLIRTYLSDLRSLWPGRGNLSTRPYVGTLDHLQRTRSHWQVETAAPTWWTHGTTEPRTVPNQRNLMKHFSLSWPASLLQCFSR